MDKNIELEFYVDKPKDNKNSVTDALVSEENKKADVVEKTFAEKSEEANNENKIKKLNKEDKKKEEKKLNVLKKLFSSCKINFLLGAGFSADILGVLNDLENCLNNAQNEEDKLTKNKIISSLYYYFFLKSISPIVSKCKNIDTFVNYKDFFELLYNLLINRNNPIENKQINIFTTNYDPIIEISLDKLRYNYNDGFAGRIDPLFDTKNYGTLYFSQAINTNRKSEIPSFNLFKLHGSVTWEGKEIATKKKTEIHYCNYENKINGFIEKKENLKKEYNNKIDFYSKFIEEYEKYFYIINPNKKKFYDTLFQSTYYDLLRIFGQELEKENSVLFVFGFSFRDEHILNIIKRATNNITLKIIIFCYTNKEYERIIKEFNYNNITFIYPKNNKKVINLKALNSILSYISDENIDKEEEKNEQ